MTTAAADSDCKGFKKLNARDLNPTKPNHTPIKSHTKSPFVLYQTHSYWFANRCVALPSIQLETCLARKFKAVTFQFLPCQVLTTKQIGCYPPKIIHPIPLIFDYSISHLPLLIDSLFCGTLYTSNN